MRLQYSTLKTIISNLILRWIVKVGPDNAGTHVIGLNRSSI